MYQATLMADSPAVYIPDRNQLRFPFDDRPTDFVQRRRAAKKLRRLELAATCPRCSYCGCEVTEKPKGKRQRTLTRATVDHVVPTSRGGTNDADNVVLACFACNTVKRDRTPEEWAADILAVTSPKRLRPAYRFLYRLRTLAAAVAAVLPFFAAKGGGH